LALAFAVVGLGYGSPVLADAGAFLSSQSYADLQAAIASTKDPLDSLNYSSFRRR
jgi:hypothetical protein